ncbi:MAG: SLBB domain-containing protein [Gemmatimonadota bacterium]|nr:SLBB domain-containing protein [Gemmatimonadota bacterium]
MTCLFVLLSLAHGATDGIAQERRIQPGDHIQIMVFGDDGDQSLSRSLQVRPVESLSRSLQVRPDGTIQYPFLSEEKITGFSLFELRLLVRTTLNQYLDAGIRAVDIAWEDGNAVGNISGDEATVSVLGQVVAPGEYTVPGRAGLQGALTAAGGPLPGALQRSIRIHRVTGEGHTEILVNLQSFYETGDLRYIPSLQEGDVVVVPGGTASSAVSVVGAVVNPGSYQPLPGSKIFDVIVQAGGFSEDARSDLVRLIKPGKGVSEDYTIDIKEFLESGQEPDNPPVSPGDIIMVPKRFISYGSVMGVLRDLTAITQLVWFLMIIVR